MGHRTSNGWAISNSSYKLKVSASGMKVMCDLGVGAYEKTNILNRTLTL